MAKYYGIEIPDTLFSNWEASQDAAQKASQAQNGEEERHWDNVMGTHYKLATQQLADLGITDRFALMEIVDAHKLKKV